MASILETFYILFKSNTEEVKKGSKEAETTTKKLNEQLVASHKITEKLGDSFTDLAKEFGSSIVGLVAAGGFAEGLKSAAEYSKELFETSEQLDINAGQLDVWGRAVERAGGSAGSFRQVLYGLDKTLNQVANYGSGSFSPQLELLGIDPHNRATKQVKNSLELLKEISVSISRINMPRARSKEILQEIGFDEGTIVLLQKGGKALDKLIAHQKSLGTIGDRDTKVVKEFSDAWDDVSESFRIAFIKLDTELLPSLTALLNSFTKVAVFIQAHARTFANIFTSMGIGLGLLATRFVALRLAAWGAAGAIGLLESPLLLVIAASVALGLAYSAVTDDLKRMHEGHDSFFGDLLLGWSTATDWINHARFNLEIFNSIITRMIPGGIFIRDVFREIAELASLISKDISGIFGKVGSTTLSGLLKGNSQVNLLPQAPGSDIALQPSSVLNNSGNALNHHVSVSTGDINISTAATDATGIAAEVGAAFKNQVRQAMNTFSSGVLI